MADAYTQVSSLNSAGNEAFDRFFWYALRTKLHYDQFATIIGAPFHQRTTHTFNITADLAEATTPLTETVDPDAVAMSDSEVQITLDEYGNAVNVTWEAEGTDIYGVDVRAANLIGYNAGKSQDSLARTQLVAGSNVQFVGQTAQGSIVAGNILSAAEIRKGVARMRGDDAIPWTMSDGREMFGGLLHPDTSVDVRAEAGEGGFAPAVNRTAAGRRWAGVVGDYEGVIWVETPRVVISTDAGDTNVDVYDNLIIGQEALAKAYSTSVSAPSAQVVRGPVVDKLMRFRPVGWKWLGGYGRFREECLQRVESASSIGSN
ncbi:MAG: N4-gp56 family major capsid protein [Actinomycetia bacterium]|nr:N4-gp56 family major capsid protein [Actinomycetes bacterium]